MQPMKQALYHQATTAGCWNWNSFEIDWTIWLLPKNLLISRGNGNVSNWSRFHKNNLQLKLIQLVTVQKCHQFQLIGPIFSEVEPVHNQMVWGPSSYSFKLYIGQMYNFVLKYIKKLSESMILMLVKFQCKSAFTLLSINCKDQLVGLH